MAGHALILLPEEAGQVLPPYFFSRIAGLPLLYRLIYSCWRSGVNRVSIMAPREARADLESHLDRIYTRKGGAVQLISDWQDLWNHTQGDQGDGPMLVLVADLLPLPTFMAEFAHFPVPAGSLALAVTGPPGSGEVCAFRERHPAYLATRQDRLITSLGFYAPPGNCCAMGLVAFSKAAWEDWRLWQGRQSGTDSGTSPETWLYPYLAEQAREKKIVAVESPPLGVSLVSGSQDLRQVGFRLITATAGSPWGEGYFEGSLNRELARKILWRISEWPVTPNYITASNYLLGLAAIAGFLNGTYWGCLAGALFLPLIMVLDCLDGLLARVIFRETWEGVLLDLYSDRVQDVLILCGISIGQYRATGRPLFLALLLPLILGYAWCWRETNPIRGKSREKVEDLLRTRSRKKQPPGERVLTEAASRDFFYLILLFALFNHLDWFILATGIGTGLFALVLLWLRRRGQD
jgi:phosphatidylglycerophosphate synthase